MVIGCVRRKLRALFSKRFTQKLLKIHVFTFEGTFWSLSGAEIQKMVSTLRFLFVNWIGASCGFSVWFLWCLRSWRVTEKHSLRCEGLSKCFSRFGSLDRQFSKIHFFRSVGPIWRNFFKNVKKRPISRVFDNKKWLWCLDDFKIISLWSLGPLLSSENLFDGHRIRKTEAEGTFLKTLHSKSAEKVKFLPLKVHLGVWAVLKFKKWSTRYVFDFKNGLVRRVAFPFGFYDADGLGES